MMRSKKKLPSYEKEKLLVVDESRLISQSEYFLFKTGGKL